MELLRVDCRIFVRRELRLRGSSIARILVEDVGGSDELTGDFIDGVGLEALRSGRPRSFGVVCFIAKGRGVLGWVWMSHGFESE